jgi:hypothetical protein
MLQLVISVVLLLAVVTGIILVSRNLNNAPQIMQTSATQTAGEEGEGGAVTISKLGVYGTSRTLYKSYVEGDLAYLANGADGLVIVNVKEPSNPVMIGQCIINEAIGITVENGFAYVIQKGVEENNQIPPDKLVVVDVKDPAKPVQVGEHSIGDFSKNYQNVTAEGSLVCVAG